MVLWQLLSTKGYQLCKHQRMASASKMESTCIRQTITVLLSRHGSTSEFKRNSSLQLNMHWRKGTRMTARRLFSWSQRNNTAILNPSLIRSVSYFSHLQPERVPCLGMPSLGDPAALLPMPRLSALQLLCWLLPFSLRMPAAKKNTNKTCT